MPSPSPAFAPKLTNNGQTPLDWPGSRKSFLCLGPGWSSASNTPFRRHKTWVHEGGISTPLIVHWPAGIAARGELRHSPAHFIDIVPTLLSLAAAEKPSQVKSFAVPPAPGVSLVPLFATDGAVSRKFLWWEHEGNRAIRVGDWKLVAPARGAWELYDLAQDRGESSNLAARHPEKVRELDALWTGQQAAFRSLALTDPPTAKAKAQPAQPQKAVRE